MMHEKLYKSKRLNIRKNPNQNGKYQIKIQKNITC